MRVLVTSTPGLGHIHPLVPLARALEQAGHELVWATDAASAERVAGYGFTPAVAGIDPATRRARLFELRPDVRSLAPRHRRAVLFPTMFARVAAPTMFADLRAWLDDSAFRPDVIVHEPGELAAAPIAAMLGVPNVTVGFGGLVPAPMLDEASDALGPLWDEAGAEPSPSAGLYDHLYLHPLPAPLGASPTAATVRRARPDAFDGAMGEPPAWIDELGRDRPLVYLTFGTEGATPPPLAQLLGAIARFDVDALLTIGSSIDPAVLPPVPPNVRVERYVPQRAVLSRATAIVSHAGSGSMIGAALAAIPQVSLPMFADQFDNADDLASTGAGITLEADAVTEDAIVDAIDRAVHDTDLRRAARALADAFAALPDPASFVPAIEALTR